MYLKISKNIQPKKNRRSHMSKIDFKALFASFDNIKVGVVGDLMLDTYWWGKADRISPEAPVPVVSVLKKEYRIGGAGNVAINLAALNAIVHTISVLGKDDEGDRLLSLMESKFINTAYVIKSAERITTNKTRIISRNQQMMRLDEEITTMMSSSDEDKLLEAFSAYVSAQMPQIIILEDYNKGVLTERVITEIIATCKKHNILVAVDPKRKNFFAYKHVDIFKPNLSEAKDALNIIADDISESVLKDIHFELFNKLEHRISFITLSEKGVFYQSDAEEKWIPTHIRSINDVSGAGDTVIAVASIVYAATKNIGLMAEMANIAGGLVCEEVGTAVINKERFLKECQLLLDKD